MASVHALMHARPVCPPGRDEGSREAAAFFSACLVGEGRQWHDGIRGLESATILHGGAHWKSPRQTSQGHVAAIGRSSSVRVV